MGGRALRQYGIKTERKSSKDFFKLASEISVQLSYGLGVTNSVPIKFKYSPSITSAPVRCYRTKQNHGDLDVLIKIDNDFKNKKINLRDYVQKHFNPQVIHNNGGVLSFDYDNFQVDFIPIHESNWEISQVYFSYDPLGNIMGKTFHKLNLSYGWDGLKYKYRNFNGRNSHDIIISKNPKKIFKFGGYDYDRYLRGFDRIEEIFEFVINGEYFDSEIFKMKNLSAIDRKRNKKRGSYHKFLKYIDDNNIEKIYNFFNDKSLYLIEIERFFPEANLHKKIKKYNEEDEINRQINLKFNGRLIMGWIPGLKGKRLGDAINKFKHFLGEDYKQIILNSTTNELKKIFINFYEKKKKEE
jgi:hypothetical protein